MSASNRAANLKSIFLQNAARSVAMDCPSTASYLVSESVQFQLASGPQNEALPSHQRQSFCTACGSIFIPGLNCSIVRGDRSGVEHKSRKVQRRTVVYRCQACFHHTTFCLPSPKASHSSTEDKDCTRSRILNFQSNQEVSSTNAVPQKQSSKKRAKARKEKEGLQSMLKKSREDTKTSPQLSLLDFMMA
ncbi:hypothetical protein GJ744_002355 [Endocarpon pusillum]|uniref:Uncharacterized protein n=1 Tax=Endocarpon pusillum TaxID=364733 RepID=A0A8H7AN80_9EURO|nr:hypothetical protein GJ744_002355 [Endocarpon pusillum]